MPSALSLIKTEARNQLRKMVPLRLKRPVFLVPGWTDQACFCWTEPYTEGGVARRPGWEYTIQDWVEKIVDPADHDKVVFIKNVEDEKNLQVKRFTSGPRKGKVRTAAWIGDATGEYENFFQFSELLKSKIRAAGAGEYDLIGHSMGGLDIISAVVLERQLDQEPEVQRFIKTPPLEGTHHIITVSTPFRGSPGAGLIKNTQLDEIFMPNWSQGIRKQGEAMAPDSSFIKIITHAERQRRLIQKVSGSVHTFGSQNDRAVPDSHRMIDGANNHPAGSFELAQHSQRMGIPQDPRIALEIFRILVS